MGKKVTDELDKDRLFDEYVRQQHTIGAIAKKFGLSHHCVYRRILRWNIPIQQRAPVAKNIAGQRFGTLVAIKQAYKNKGNTWMWLCRCDCGNEIIVQMGTIQTQKSCGCLNHIEGNKAYRWQGYEQISKTLYTQIKNSALARGLEFTLTLEFLWRLYEQQNSMCALTGLEINLPRTWKDKGVSASLDRIDSSKGYVPDNVQWVHKTVNKMKQNLDEKEFIHFCRLVSRHHGI